MRRAVVVVPLLVLVAGCSSGGGSTDSAGSAAKSSSSGSGGVVVQPAVQRGAPAPLPRSVIRTAELEVRVADVKRAVSAAERIVLDRRGAVADERLDLRSSPTAALQLRVPPDALTSTLSELAGLGHEQSRRLGTDDVTEQVVDLASRLATQRRSVARVRALLDSATSLTDVVRLESELSKREADLESLDARRRALAGSVAMATVTLDLRADPAHAVVGGVGFGDGLRGGWKAFTATARVSAATLGAVLPFLPLLLVAGWLALRLRRRAAATP